MWWVLLVALLVAVLFLPVGILASYNEQGGTIFLKVGPIKISLYPAQKKEKQNTAGKAKKDNSKAAKPKKASEAGASDYWPILKNLLEFLGKVRRQVTIKKLFVKAILAGDDPCDLSVRYGVAWAALGNLIPLINSSFKVKKQNVEVMCDYLADKTVFTGLLEISITLVGLLALVLRYGVRILKQYISIKNQKKGGTDYESKSSSNA